MALAISACAVGPASSAGAATPLDQVTSQALAAAGQVTTQVDATANGVTATLERTGSAVDRVGRATGTVLREAAPADAGRAVDVASGGTARSIDVVDVARQATGTRSPRRTPPPGAQARPRSKRRPGPRTAGASASTDLSAAGGCRHECPRGRGD